MRLEHLLSGSRNFFIRFWYFILWLVISFFLDAVYNLFCNYLRIVNINSIAVVTAYLFGMRKDNTMRIIFVNCSETPIVVSTALEHSPIAQLVRALH